MRRNAFDPAKIALIGVPSSAGARQVGQEQAPRCLRRAGLVEGLRSGGHEVVDLGDFGAATFAPDARHPRRQNLPLVLGVLEQVAGAVDAAVDRRAWPLIVGGDCTVTIGVLASLATHFPDLGLLYFDGDVDCNTPDTTVSGILDGMVLAHILGDGAPELSHAWPRHPLLDEHKVTLFGYSLQAGGIDPAEVELLRDTRMAKVPLEAVDGRARIAAEQALRELEGKAEHLLVHFDVDVIDVAEFPAVDVPHQPGLTLVQAQEALGVFLGSAQVVGLVVTEFNAGRDPDGTLARRLSDLIQGAMSRRPVQKMSLIKSFRQ